MTLTHNANILCLAFPRAKRVNQKLVDTESELIVGSEDIKIKLNNQIWGDFEVFERLGRGAMGEVYKGRQISLDRLVALKVLAPNLAFDENLSRRFEVEAKSIAQISSPHVVQMYAAGCFEGREYFAMEYVVGIDLEAKLSQGYKPTFIEALDIIGQAALGLQAANDHGIIHRDIKPSNMMITDRGIVKLMDFGLAKMITRESANLTMSGSLLGTVNYLSPEQSRGETCDKRSDIFSLGIVLYEMLAGMLPFSGDIPAAIIYQINFSDPKLPSLQNPNVPEHHEAIALKWPSKKTGRSLSKCRRIDSRYKSGKKTKRACDDR